MLLHSKRVQRAYRHRREVPQLIVLRVLRIARHRLSKNAIFLARCTLRTLLTRSALASLLPRVTLFGLQAQLLNFLERCVRFIQLLSDALKFSLLLLDALVLLLKNSLLLEHVDVAVQVTYLTVGASL